MRMASSTRDHVNLLVLARGAVSIVTKPAAEHPARGRTLAGCQRKAQCKRPPAAQKHILCTIYNVSHPSTVSNHSSSQLLTNVWLKLDQMCCNIRNYFDIFFNLACLYNLAFVNTVFIFLRFCKEIFLDIKLVWEAMNGHLWRKRHAKFTISCSNFETAALTFASENVGSWKQCIYADFR